MAEKNKKGPNLLSCHFRRSSSHRQGESSPSTNRKSVASMESEKSLRSRTSGRGSFASCNRTDSRGTRMSIESKAATTTKTESSNQSRMRSIDSKSTVKTKKGSVSVSDRTKSSKSSTGSSFSHGKSASVSDRTSKDIHSAIPSTKTMTTQTTQTRRRGRKGWKGAPTAYSLFVKSYFSEFRKKNPTEKIPFITLSRRCAEKWHSLPNPIKQEFFRMAERATTHFNLRKMKIPRSAIGNKTSHRFLPIYMRRRPISGSIRSLATTAKSFKSALSKRSSQTGHVYRSIKPQTSAKKKPRVMPSKSRAEMSVQSSASSRPRYK